MSDFKFKLNRSGVRELLKSKEMQNIVNDHAKNALSRLGDGYKMDTFVGKNRVNASVRTSTKEAVKDNSENNSLLKAVHK